MRDRRRRLLPEDPAANGLAAPPARLSGTESDAAQTYAAAAKQARLRAVHTLLPFGKLGIALATGLSLAGVAGCIGLHLAAGRLLPWLGAEATSSLRLDVPASLGNWLAATFLALSAATAVFIYSLRRHRLDDYHGRYRVWITLALIFFISSLLESTRLVTLGRELARHAAAAGSVRFDVAWPVAITAMLLAIGVRLAIEIRRCGPALSALSMVAIGLGISATARYGWPIEHSEAMLPLWARGSWLASYALLFLTLLVYGRRVQIDVAGEAIAAKPKRKKSPAPVQEPAKPVARKPALKLRTDLDPVETVESRPEPEEEKPEPNPEPVVASVPVERSKRLSKAERRKLRAERRMAS